jgi:hypothetical protein
MGGSQPWTLAPSTVSLTVSAALSTLAAAAFLDEIPITTGHARALAATSAGCGEAEPSAGWMICSWRQSCLPRKGGAMRALRLLRPLRKGGTMRALRLLRPLRKGGAMRALRPRERYACYVCRCGVGAIGNGAVRPWTSARPVRPQRADQSHSREGHDAIDPCGAHLPLVRRRSRVSS